MYVKKVRKRNGKTQKVYEYIHLVENVRTEKGPRQRLILNLGNLDIYPTQYRAFAKRVENILTGQRSFLDLDANLEKQARAAAEKIFRKQAKEIGESEETEYQRIDVNSLESGTNRSLGPEYVCHSTWEELKLDRFLNRQGITRNVVPLIEALVIGRLIDPGNERYTKQWAESRSALFELSENLLRPSLYSYYRAGDRLLRVKEWLEEHIAGVERELFSLSERTFFFDLRNTYFEGRGAENLKAWYGRSREKSDNCKLVTLGLLVDECGFSKHSQLFAGNSSEGEFLEDMIKGLESHTPDTAKDRTVVLDAGMVTDGSVGWLKANGYHYVVMKGGLPFEGDYKEVEAIREDKQKGINAEVHRVLHEGELYIVRRYAQKANKEPGMHTRIEKLFLERLGYYKRGLRLPNRIKKYEKVVELIAKLKEKYPKVSKWYDVEVRPEKGKDERYRGIRAVDIVWEKKSVLHEEETDLKNGFVLRTDRLDLSNNEIREMYRMLVRIEHAFRSMKSFLGLRQGSHQIGENMDAHMCISVLAYHLMHSIEYRLRRNGDHRGWSTIRNVLKTHERLTIGYKAKDDDGALKQQYIRINSNAQPEHMKIYRKLGLSGRPLLRKKLVKNH